jgi:hypothetical protein
METPYELKKLKARSGPYEILRYSFICIVQVVKESRNSIFMKAVFAVVWIIVRVTIYKIRVIHIKKMSKETEREEIKDETHELEDEEQDESEDEDVDEDWKVSMIITTISVISNTADVCKTIKIYWIMLASEGFQSIELSRSANCSASLSDAQLLWQTDWTSIEPLVRTRLRCWIWWRRLIICFSNPSTFFDPTYEPVEIYTIHVNIKIKAADMAPQIVWTSLYNIASSKPKLLAVVTVVVLSLMVVPVILPHISDTSTIYHLLLHIISLIIAIFLGIVSVLAYLKNGSWRLLFMMLGFFLLSGVETIYLFDVSSNVEDIVIPVVDIELSHVIFLAMLTLFGIGIFTVSK